MLSNRLKKRLTKDRLMTSITLRIPVDVDKTLLKSYLLTRLLLKHWLSGPQNPINRPF
jgi:hypothetical protein